jgi:poly-gamma-glutamate capsule biosynthesis protein CapA/YwtB (metallophosphatase superfamily)
MARLPRPQTRIDPALLMSHQSIPRLSCQPRNPHNRFFSMTSRLVTSLLTFTLLASSCQSTPTPTASPSATGVLSEPLPTASPTIRRLAASPTQQITTAPSASPSPTPTPPAATDEATPTAPPVTTLLFTGVIVPARCIQATLDENGNPDYLYEEVRHLIAGADLAVGVLNATMSDRVVQTGCARTFQLVGRSNNADAAQRAGFDLMSVATNHIKDCGKMKSWCDFALLDTLDNLHRVGIQTVGAGKDLAEALQPVVITIHGVRFGFVSLGDRKMDENIFAGPDYPGIANLTPENLQLAMSQVRKIADVVIALPHWGNEDNSIPSMLQRQQAGELIDAGADLIVGNHTHVVQAIDEIEGIPVFFGLGNFVFDQDLRPQRQGVILLVKFQGTKYLGYELIPTRVYPDGRVHIAVPAEATEVMERILFASLGITATPSVQPQQRLP